MKVLFCPAHYTYDDISRGSELSWAFNIISRISKNNKNNLVITGFKNLNKNESYRVLELNPDKKTIDLSLMSSLIFNLKYTAIGTLYLFKENFDIHHHVLPFSINRTFNLFRIMGIKKRNKFIIGPIQCPIPNYSDNIHDFNVTKTNNFSIWIQNLLIYLLNYPLSILSYLTLKSADRIIAIDERAKKLLVNIGINSNKIEIIPPGIDTNRFRPHAKEKSVFNILTVSYLIKRKRVDLIIKSAKLLKEKKTNFKLTIVGDGPEMNKLKKLTKNLDLANYIKFVGFVQNNEIQKYYSDSDVFVSMSAHESWGQMYLEAMSCALPVISSKNNGSMSILKPDFSILVDNEIELADNLLNLINNPNLLLEMSSNARKEVKNKYDWESVIIPMYKTVYNSLTK